MTGTPARAGRLVRDPANARGIARLRILVRTRLRRQARDLAHDHTHTERVATLAERLAEAAATDHGWTIDADVVVSAALLRELGGGSRRGDESAADASARMAEDLLRAEGLDDLVWPVCEVLLRLDDVAADVSLSPEGAVLRDALLLDDIGAMGVIRSVLLSAARAFTSIHDLEDPAGESRVLDPDGTVLDAIRARLFSIPERMVTDAGRTEAELRVETVRAFWFAAVREARGGL